MIDMIKFEIKKFSCKKSLYIFLSLIIGITFIYFYFFDYIYDETKINFEEKKLTVVEGEQGIVVRKELGRKFGGVLTDELVGEIELQIQETERRLDNLSDDQKEMLKNHYRDQMSLLNYLKQDTGERREVSEVFDESLVLGYHDGWDKMILSMESVSMIFIALFVVILFSGTFVEEKNLFMDGILCSTKFGRTKVITSKIVASIIVGISILILIVIFNLIVYGTTYGLDGASVDIQASSRYVKSEYFINFAQLYLFTILLNVLGLCAIISTTVFVSACSKNAVAAMIVSLLINFMPIIFDFSESLPTMQKALELFPIYMLHTNGIFSVTNSYLGIRQPIWMIIISCLLIVVMILLTKKVYRYHQV